MPELTRTCFSTREKVKAGVLRHLYSAYKKVKRVGEPLGRDAESPHTPGDDYNWNESLYFNFIDPRTRVGGYTRIGILPNQESDIGVMMLYAGGSRLLATYQAGRVVADENGFAIGGIAYRRLDPLWRWRLEFKGDMVDLEDARMLMGLDTDNVSFEKVEVDVTFEGVAPPFNFKNADPAAIAEMVVAAGTKLGDLRNVSRVSSEHYEQTGKYSGTIRMGDEEISFVGSGHRDHSWGVRDWSAPRLWTWLTCQFSDELAFNLSRVAIDSVDVFNGFICRGGVNYPVRRAVLTTEFEDDGVTQKKVRFSMEDTGGEMIEVSGDVLTVIPLDLRARGYSTLVNEALTEYHWKGRTAYGIAEYLHQMTARTT